MIQKKHKVSILLASYVFLICFCGSISSCRKKQSIDDIGLKHEIEKLTGLSFSQKIDWIGIQLDRGMDYYLYIAFKIPKEEISTLFKKINFEWTDEIRHVRDSDGGCKWFKPDSIKVFRSATSAFPKSNNNLNVLYDDSSNDEKNHVICYLVWFELD